MTKRFFLLLLTAFSVSALKAQYFEHLYGSTETEMVSDGHNAYEGGNTGHFMVSPYQSGAAGTDFFFNAQRTDLDGNISPSPYFNNRYYVTDIFGSGWHSDNPNIKINSVKSVEHSSGNGFAVVGSYGDALFLARLDPDGTAPGTSARRYLLNSGGGLTVTSVTEDGIYIYVCGAMRTTSGETRAFAMALIATVGPFYGDIYWAHTYDVDNNSATGDIPYDILVSPHNGVDLLLVGETSKAYDDGRGFVMNLYRNSGVIQTVKTYDLGHEKSHFTCITPAFNTNVDASGAGFVIGGTDFTKTPHNTDIWMVGMDDATLTVNPSWNFLFDHGKTPPPAYTFYDECSDILERYNTLGAYEYYIAGNTTYPNYRDRVVVKLDDMGAPVTNGQYSYTKYEADDLVRMDMLDGYGTHIDGLALFGSVSYSPGYLIGGWDHSLLKTYFNGETGCNLLDADNPVTPGAPAVNETVISNPNSDYDAFDFTDYYMFVSINTSISNAQVCYATSVPGGSNALPFEEESDPQAGIELDNQNTATGIEGLGAASFNLYPSLANSQTRTVSLKGYAPKNERMQLTLVDVNGKVLQSDQYQVRHGNARLTFQIHELDLQPGIYYLQLRGTSIHESFKIMMTGN